MPSFPFRGRRRPQSPSRPAGWTHRLPLRFEALEDRSAPAVTPISVVGPGLAPDSAEGESGLGETVTTPDGRFVVFVSQALNLIPNFIEPL